MTDIERQAREPLTGYEKAMGGLAIASPIIGIFAAVVCGCRHIEIDKHDPIPYPSETNAVAWIDGGYEFCYLNWGFKTDIDSITADKTKDGVKIVIGKIETDVSDRHDEIIGSAGTAVGNVAQKVVDGVKGVETLKTN